MTQPVASSATEIHPLEWFILDEHELARHDDPEKIRLDGQDMLAKGQLQAVGATEDGRMIFGHGRWLAAKAAGKKTLEVKIFPATLSETQFKLIRAAENLHRKELTFHRKWQLAVELMTANPTWSQKTLAEQLQLSEGMIVKLLSPSKCSSQWQDALKAGRVTISDCYSASMLTPGDQDALLALKLSGVNRDTLERQSKRMRNGNVSAVRASRIKCQLVSGVDIVVSGSEMTLDDMIDALAEAGKEARKARDQGLDAKTFQSVMRDRARAGG